MGPGRRNALTALTIAAVAAGLVGCAPKRVLRAPVPGEAETPAARPGVVEPAPDVAAIAVAMARDQVGTRYAFGGSDPGSGFDCSGLVQWAYLQAGVTLPRRAEEQLQVGRMVDEQDLRPGDLVFFAISTRDRVDHVGIYAGKRRFLHAPKAGDVVRSESLNDAWWHRRWRASRRVVAASD